MAKNYYLILGVSSDASQNQIKGAYHRLAKEYHPDYFGGDSRPFCDIQEAYSVLKDRDLRRDYDRRLRQAAVWPQRSAEPLRSSEASAGVVSRRKPEAEPMIPEDRRADLGDVSLSRSFHSYSPSYDEVFDWIWRNFASVSPPKSGAIRELEAVVPLTSEQARRGGQARVLVPTRATCPTCRGRGGVGPYECWRCAGEGALSGEVPISLSFAPGVPQSVTVQIPLERFGIRNLQLRVHFRVTE